MPQSWQLRVVGESLLISSDGKANALSAGSKRFAVLTYLAIPTPGRWVRRDVLLATFWPELDSARARNALRVTLHQLRNVLGGDAIRVIGDEQVALDPSLVAVDIDDLSAALAGDAALPWLARASLELVPGLHVPDAPAFQEWLDEQRRALNARIVSAAWKLAADKAEAGDVRQAITAARAATRLTREDEAGLRRLMWLLDRAGDRAGALAEFELFEAWLQEQLEVEPAPETVAMVRRIRDRTQANGDDAVVERAYVVVRPETLPQETLSRDIVAATRPRRSRMRAVVWAMIVLVAATGIWLSQSKAANSSEHAPIAISFASQIADSTSAYIGPALSESVADEFFSPVVLPYTATRALASQDMSLMRKRAQDLGARTLIWGTITGGRDSLQLQIVIENVVRFKVLGSIALSGSERELLSLRDRVVAEIRNVVNVPRRPPRSGHIPNPEAYQLSLNAFYLLGRRSRDELLEARKLYTKATELDPGWTDLWIGLARVEGSLAFRHFIDYRTGMRASEFAAGQALERASEDPRALVERALARFHLGDRIGAEADIKRAEGLDSIDYHMQSLIGTWWRWNGGLDSAAFYKRRAQRLASWDRQVTLDMLAIVECSFDSKATIAEAQRARDIDPSAPSYLESYAWALADLGRWDDATAEYKRRYSKFEAAGVTTAADRLSGEARFRATVRALRNADYQERRQPGATPSRVEDRVGIFEDMGMRDSALFALASVVDSTEAHRTNVLCGPNLRSFREDPRALDIVKRRGWILGEFAPK